MVSKCCLLLLMLCWIGAVAAGRNPGLLRLMGRRGLNKEHGGITIYPNKNRREHIEDEDFIDIVSGVGNFIEEESEYDVYLMHDIWARLGTVVRTHRKIKRYQADWYKKEMARKERMFESSRSWLEGKIRGLEERVESCERIVVPILERRYENRMEDIFNEPATTTYPGESSSGVGGCSNEPCSIGGVLEKILDIVDEIEEDEERKELERTAVGGGRVEITGEVENVPEPMPIISDWMGEAVLKNIGNRTDTTAPSDMDDDIDEGAEDDVSRVAENGDEIVPQPNPSIDITDRTEKVPQAIITGTNGSDTTAPSDINAGSDEDDLFEDLGKMGDNGNEIVDVTEGREVQQRQELTAGYGANTTDHTVEIDVTDEKITGTKTDTTETSVEMPSHDEELKTSEFTIDTENKAQEETKTDMTKTNVEMPVDDVILVSEFPKATTDAVVVKKEKKDKKPSKDGENGKDSVKPITIVVTDKKAPGKTKMAKGGKKEKDSVKPITIVVSDKKVSKNKINK